MIELFPFSDHRAERREVFFKEVCTYRSNPTFILGMTMWAISQIGLITFMLGNWWLAPFIFLNIFGFAFAYDSVVAHFCDRLLGTQDIPEGVSMKSGTEVSETSIDRV